MTQGKLTIKSELTEQELIEGLLNMKYSGITNRNLLLILSFHALANSWHFNKLSYYLNLLEIRK